MRLNHMSDFYPSRNPTNTGNINLHHRRGTADQIVFEFVKQIHTLPNSDRD